MLEARTYSIDALPIKFNADKAKAYALDHLHSQGMPEVRCFYD